MDIDKRFKIIKITIGVNQMCLAVSYSLEKKQFITHFTDANAQLLIKMDGKLNPIRWGRRLEEKSKLPLGGWISQELKAKGLYDHFFPKEVKIVAVKFLEHDIEGRCIWSDITDGCWLAGLLLREHNEQRVYIQTFLPEKAETQFTRWPKILIG